MEYWKGSYIVKTPDQGEQAVIECIEKGYDYFRTYPSIPRGQALQSVFAEIGVNLELKPVETGTWWQLFGDGDYFVSRGGYPMEEENTDVPFFDMYHKTGTFNVSRINDPKLNELLEQARVEVDPEKRDGIYQDITRIIYEEAYSFPNFYTISTLMYNADLKNVEAVSTQKYLYRNYSWQ